MPPRVPAAPSARTRLRRVPDKAAYDRATVEAILDAMPVAHVGYILDGAPVVIPTLQWREGDHIYWHGSSASRSLKAGRGAQVCVTVTLVDGMVMARSGFEHSVNHRSVMIFGEARAITDREAKRRHLQAMFDRLFPGRWETLRPITDQELTATGILSLPISESSAKIATHAPGGTDAEEDRAFPVWAGVLPIWQTTGAPIPAPDLPAGVTLPEGLARWRFGEIPE